MRDAHAVYAMDREGLVHWSARWIQIFRKKLVKEAFTVMKPCHQVRGEVVGPAALGGVHLRFIQDEGELVPPISVLQEQVMQFLVQVLRMQEPDLGEVEVLIPP